MAKFSTSEAMADNCKFATSQILIKLSYQVAATLKPEPFQIWKEQKLVQRQHKMSEQNNLYVTTAAEIAKALKKKNFTYSQVSNQIFESI